MKNIYEKIITEIKKMEYKGMIVTMFVSIMLFIVDILHLFLKFDFCDLYRHFYVFAFCFSFIFFMNKQGREERLEKERIIKEVEQQKLNAQKMMTQYRAVIPAIDNLTLIQKNILYQFVANNNSVITITDDTITKLHEVHKINYCLTALDLNIKIRTATPYLILEIDKEYLTLLKLCFSEGLTKINKD